MLLPGIVALISVNMNYGVTEKAYHKPDNILDNIRLASNDRNQFDMRCFVFTIAFLLSACSTIDKKIYYTPKHEHSMLSGPEKLYCGITQFSNEPDKLTYQGLSYKANEQSQIYAWGPWLITVIPVFPVTWIRDFFTNPKLSLSITTTEKNLHSLPDADQVPLQIRSDNGKTESFYAETSYVKNDTLHLIYPVRIKDVKSFTFISDNTEHIATFTRTARWSWTQICVN